MLVQCPECTTKYNLDESKIGHDGSKVRCTRCKNVFTVFRPMAQEAEAFVAPEPGPAPATAVDESFEDEMSALFEEKKPASPARPVVDESLEDELSAMFEEKGPVPVDKPAMDDSFDDELSALFEDKKPAPAAKPVVDQSFEDELSAMFEDKKPVPAAKSPVDDSFENDLTAMLNEKQAKTTAKPSVDEDMLADLQGAFQQPLIDKSDKALLREEEDSSAKPKKSGSMGLIFGLVLLLLACAGGGIYFFQPGLLGLGPAQTSAPSEPAPPAKEGAAQIALENVRQYFVPNEKEGQLFIIEGKAVNRFPEARELIRLKASLFDKQGAEVAMQEFMCGNVVSLYQLQVSTRADIEAALTAKVGILTNNTNIQPGASVPFMAVFFSTPDTVEEFGLEVIQSTVPQQ
jgi:predicted Zn finger-like uncharacterized protein